METTIQALIISFREGLEAFLMIGVMLKFLDKTNNKILKKHIWNGTLAGIFTSLLFGMVLMKISSFIDEIDTVSKLWESIASFIAVILITTFIIWMIKHSGEIKKHIENKAILNLSKKGVFLLAMFMVAREGAEIAIFAFAGKYSIIPITIGIALAVGIVVLIHHSIVNIKLKTIFFVTLIYLILQAGFLLGNSIHEGLSALNSLNVINQNSHLFIKAFDLSKTVFYHKEGAVGLPLYIALGWYSKPEWIQFIIQYGYTILFFSYWYNKRKKI